jgi:hypothetical protein
MPDRVAMLVCAGSLGTIPASPSRGSEQGRFRCVPNIWCRRPPETSSVHAYMLGMLSIQILGVVYCMHASGIQVLVFVRVCLLPQTLLYVAFASVWYHNLVAAE